MNPRVHALVVTFVLVAASSSVAQQTPREPAGPPGAVPEPLPLAILDVRGASVGLPTGIGWTPAVPVGAQIPGRGIGFDVGAHLYPLRTKLVAIGLGGTVLVGRGRTSPPDTSGTATSTLTPLPGVRTTLTGLVPQVSFNFGHRLGW
ncbi:MAG TPA: hypothetical protein VEK56_10065, partial [Vicinamibacterales bacterium]|nr:hypothetical protein [Vicinamibacterales bacterium]